MSRCMLPMEFHSMLFHDRRLQQLTLSAAAAMIAKACHATSRHYQMCALSCAYMLGMSPTCTASSRVGLAELADRAFTLPISGLLVCCLNSVNRSRTAASWYHTAASRFTKPMHYLPASHFTAITCHTKHHTNNECLTTNSSTGGCQGLQCTCKYLYQLTFKVALQ